MILESVKLYAYNLPLKKELQLGNKLVNCREGVILELISDDQIKSISEIAPLPNFSKETMHDVIKEIKSFKNKFAGNAIPPDLLSQLAEYAPSVRFGIESAFLQMMAQSKELTLVDLLSPNAKQIVSVNALLTGSQSEILERAAILFENGYRAFKMKVGRNDFDNEVETIFKVREIVGDDCLIRLDANRAFDLETALIFFEKVKSVNIDYIEEPFQTFEILKKYILETDDVMPIALDESLRELQPDMLNDLYALKAIVLKPTLLGYTSTMMFAKKAFALGIQPVISSSFETSIGSYVLASMGAVIDSKISIGLDTLSWFEDDLIATPLTISNGKIDLTKQINLNSGIDFSKLVEVNLDN